MFKSVFITMVFIVALGLGSGSARAYQISEIPDTINVVNGSFSYLGNVTFDEFYNESEPTTVRLSAFSSFFDMRTSPVSMLITSPLLRLYLLSATLAPDFPAGTYPVTFVAEVVNSSYDATIRRNFSVVVPSVFNFTVPLNNTIEAPAGRAGVVWLNVTGTGNTDGDVALQTYAANASIFHDVPASINVLRSQATPLPLYFNAPFVVENITETIAFADKNVTFNFVFTDKEIPIIINVALPSKFSWDTAFVIDVDVRDNIRVDSVYSYFCGYPFNLTRVSNVTWEVNIVPNKTGPCQLLVTAIDTSNNGAVVFQRDINIETRDGIDVAKLIQMPRRKTDAPPQLFRFMSTEQATDVNMSIIINTPVVFDPVLNMSVNKPKPKFTVSTGGFVQPMEENVSYTIKVAGDAYLVVSSDKETEYDITLHLGFPLGSGHEDTDVNIRGTIGNYSVTQEFNLTVLDKFRVAGKQNRCYPDDEGIYENSTLICETFQPVDTPQNDIQFPFPKSEFDLALGNKDFTISVQAKDINFYRTLAWVMIACIVAIVISSLIYWRYYKGRSI